MMINDDMKMKLNILVLLVLVLVLHSIIIKYHGKNDQSLRNLTLNLEII